MGPDGRWKRLDYGVFDTPSNRVETSALFGTASIPTDESLDSYWHLQFPITSSYPQSHIINHQDPYQLSTELPPSFITPPSSISYYISPSPRNPATDIQYSPQDRRIQQVQMPDGYAYAMDRKSPLTDTDDMRRADWLHYDSELKWLALYQPDDATSRLASNSANVPTGEWPSQFLPMIGGKYVLEESYGHEMVRLWPCSCSLRPAREGVIMPAREGRHTNIIIEYRIIKASSHRSIYFVVIGLHVLMVEIMDKYSHSTCNPTFRECS